MDTRYGQSDWSVKQVLYLWQSISVNKVQQGFENWGSDALHIHNALGSFSHTTVQHPLEHGGASCQNYLVSLHRPVFHLESDIGVVARLQ